MHVVIVGCGRVGSSLARDLLGAGHTAAVIDRRPSAFERLGKNFAGITVAGIGFDRDRLIEAGIERAEAVAAVTNGDNSNILVARVARETFGIERVVARIYDPRRAAIYQRLGIATVATSLWTTERVLRRVLPDAPAVEWVDPSAKISLVERTLGPTWAGHSLLDLEDTGRRVMAISRLGSGLLATPELMIQEGDIVYLAVTSDAVGSLDAVSSGPSGPAGQTSTHPGGHK
ncbi:MAG: TrkA family potassium uptake protein [Ilumatobacteraceae bacterium]